MRKDVKFGLTVGAILVATLIVYVIVLSGGGLSNTSKQDGKTVAINTGESPSPAPLNPTDSPAAAVHPDGPMTESPAPAPSAPIPVDIAPATQPAVASQSSSDWDYRLNHQVADVAAPAADQPQRTETPLIERNAGMPSRPTIVTANNSQPTIDSIIPLMAAPANLPARVDVPTTQPAAMVNGADPAIPTVSGQRTHRIASGENLWTIAAAVYGNGSYFTKIVAANPDLNPKELKVGKILIIPDLTATEKQPASATPAAQSTPTSAPINSSTNYRVASGDTLEKIARKLYNDATMQDKIYASNKALMGDNPDKLKIGWVLTLPKAPTVSQTADASH